MAFNEENEEAQIQLASIAYNTIKDADIKVTDEELKAKYEELEARLPPAAGDARRQDG